jgi:DNA-binding phage protein
MEKENTKASAKYDDFIVGQLKKDPRFLEAYLNEALSEDNEDPRVVQDMIRQVGGVLKSGSIVVRKTV